MNEHETRVRKDIALRRVRTGYYDRKFADSKVEALPKNLDSIAFGPDINKLKGENNESTFSKEQREEVTEHGKRQTSVCVYGDS